MINFKSNLTISQRIENLRNKIMLNAIKLRERIKNGTVFKFKEFSKKQLKVLTWWTDESPMKDQGLLW